MYLNLFTSTTSSSPTSSLKIGSEKTQNQRIFEYISSFRDLWIQNQDFKKFQASCEKLHEILRISCCGKVPLNLCYPVQLAISKSRTKSGKSQKISIFSRFSTRGLLESVSVISASLAKKLEQFTTKKVVDLS